MDVEEKCGSRVDETRSVDALEKVLDARASCGECTATRSVELTVVGGKRVANELSERGAVALQCDEQLFRVDAGGGEWSEIAFEALSEAVRCRTLVAVECQFGVGDESRDSLRIGGASGVGCGVGGAVPVRFRAAGSVALGEEEEKEEGAVELTKNRRR